MAVITMTESGDQYPVRVQERGSSSQHRMTIGLGQLGDLGGGAPAKELIEASFQVLLEREPKESNLIGFDLDRRRVSWVAVGSEKVRPIMGGLVIDDVTDKARTAASAVDEH